MIKFNTFRYAKSSQIPFGSVAELVDAPDLKSFLNIFTLANSTTQRLAKVNGLLNLKPIHISINI